MDINLTEIEDMVRAQQGEPPSKTDLYREIGRLRTAFRVNMLRDGHSDAEIDAVLNETRR